MTVFPSGRYRGRVTSPWWAKPAGLVWKGKRFGIFKVRNLLLGRELITGRLELDVDYDQKTVLIIYPFGLMDRLRPDEAHPGRWTGTMKLGWLVVRFTLTPWD